MVSLLTWSQTGSAAGHESCPACLCAGRLVPPGCSRPCSAPCISPGCRPLLQGGTGSDALLSLPESSPRWEVERKKWARTSRDRYFSQNQSQFVCRSAKRVSDLVTQGCQVSLKAFVFTLQSLDAGQVVTIVVSVEGLVLLLNPFFSFISIPEQKHTQLCSNHSVI